MDKGICLLSQVPGRKKPADASEMITQLVFGDTFEILEDLGKWLHIKQSLDAYESYIDKKQCTFISQATYDAIQQEVPKYSGELVHIAINQVSGEVYPLVIGSRLPLLNDGLMIIENHSFAFDGDFHSIDKKAELIDTAYLFLNSPYLWGGKSPMGIDCSGFVQTVFKLTGIELPRDAYQQAEIGETLNFVDEAIAGDVAFFDNEEGRITHVGIMLDNKQIIHASGKVRIDLIDHYGIYNEETSSYSHKLRLIKRI